VFKLAKLLHLYRVRVGAGLRQTLAASVAGLGLAHTIGCAVLKGLFTRNEPFFRTPKNARAHTLAGALAACREEALLACALLLGAYAVTRIPIMDSPDLRAWVLVLLVQSVPALSAVIAAVVSALPLPARFIGQGYVPAAADEEYAMLVHTPVAPAANGEGDLRNAA